MGDPIPITKEKKYTFEGFFDVKETYKFIKEFLEDSKHYDVTEKEYDEKNEGGEKKIAAKAEAEKIYNDYYKVILKFEIELEGKDVVVEEGGKSYQTNKGKATFIVNSYIEQDLWNRKPKGALPEFLAQVYSKYVGRDEKADCIKTAVMDANEVMNRFKQSMNASL